MGIEPTKMETSLTKMERNGTNQWGFNQPKLGI
jgi:hypothetical protein